MINILPMFVATAIALVIMFTEVIKRFDRKNRLKGYRVWIPAVLSCGAAWLLRLGNFFQEPNKFWFWWAAIFGVSIFGYEAVLQKIRNALDRDASAARGPGNGTR